MVKTIVKYQTKVDMMNPGAENPGWFEYYALENGLSGRYETRGGDGDFTIPVGAIVDVVLFSSTPEIKSWKNIKTSKAKKEQQIFLGTVLKQISINLRCKRPTMPRQVEFYLVEDCTLVAFENYNSNKDFTIPLGATVQIQQGLGTAKVLSWKEKER
jgi:hypothetical protein